MTNDEILVSVPARAALVHVVRSVAAAVAARMDFPVDAIEDLKIAVDETASQLLRGSTAQWLTFRFSAVDEGLEVVASADGPAKGAWPPEGYERSLAWQVLTALTDETAYHDDETGAGLRFAKRRATVGG